MVISPVAALEIFTNPTDLEIIIKQDDDGYGFAITRGPGRDHKVIIDTCGFVETQDLAIEEVEKKLNSICRTMQLELADPESFISRYFNPDKEKLKQEEFLNQDMINRIIFELKQNGAVSTCRMLAPSEG